MAKCKVIGLNEAWWIWIDGQSAVRVASEQAAGDLLRTAPENLTTDDAGKRLNVANPVAELLWNKPLLPGQTFHKTVISPVSMVLHQGQCRKIVRHLSPSEFSRIAKGWLGLEPELPAWWPKQYSEACENPDVLVMRGKKSLCDQINARWPQV